MVKRSVIILISCAAFLLVDKAAAQPYGPEQAYLATPQVEIKRLASRLKHGFVPVQVWHVESPTVLAVGEPGTFTAAANLETASLPLRCRWDFGDGTSAAGLAAQHVYEEPGTYRVTFTIANDGSEASGSLTVTVVAAAPGHDGSARASG